MSDRQFPASSRTLAANPDGAAPSAGGEVLSRWRERVLNYLLRGAALAGLLAWAGNSYADVQNRDWADLAVISIIYGIVVTITFVQLTYRLRAGLTILLVYALLLNSLRSAGIRGDAQLFAILIVVLALMLFSARAGWIMLGITVLTEAGAAWATVTGRLALGVTYDQLDPSVWLPLVVVMVLVASLIMLGVILLQREFQAAQERERQAAQEVRQERELLELRVAERTRALETSAQISRRLSTLLDERQVVDEVVEQLRSGYHFYHVHIYLFDATREYLELAGGTGEVGRLLKAQGHHLAAGHGLVGRAADTNTVVLASDVSQMAGWLPNPLLPDTRSEVAVPIALGGQVLGVLDVQQNVVGGLKPSDAELIQAVAQQAAIALQNARSFAEAQREAQAEALIRQITREIQSAATAPAALQVAVRELGQALGAQEARVRLRVAGRAPEADPAGKAQSE
jgi:putative methionine-R-sulfoxide reductase with GAF domain